MQGLHILALIHSSSEMKEMFPPTTFFSQQSAETDIIASARSYASDIFILYHH